MFSQFRQAVENLAPVPGKFTDGEVGDAREHVARSNSPDLLTRAPSPVTSSQLAESALTSLRRSFTAQHSSSMSSRLKPINSPSPRESRAKMRLEDRLRAATSALGDVPISETTRRQSPPPSTAEPTAPSSTSLDSFPSSLPIVATSDAHVIDFTSDTVSSPSSLITQNLAPSKIENPPNCNVATHKISEVQSTTNPNDNTPGLKTDEDTSIETNTKSLGAVYPAEVDNTTESLQQVAVAHSISLPAESEHLRDSAQEPLNPVVVSQADTSAFDSNLNNTSTTSEELHAQLRQLEQRFTDMTASFQRLQAEKEAADRVLRELTPLESIVDSAKLQDYLQEVTSDTTALRDELKHLNSELHLQENRMEEIRATYQGESSSQATRILKLQNQLIETEALFRAAQTADTRAEAAAAEQKAENDLLKKDLGRAQVLAKEEEEKRVKAISLLKTVRQKLVKAEKEKDDVSKEMASLLQKGENERENGMAETSRLQSEIDFWKSENESIAASLNLQFDKNLANLKDKYEKELFAAKEKHELEGVSIKATHLQEIAFRESQIRSLQQSLKSVAEDKNVIFEDLQLRQAEFESAQSHLQLLENQATEYQYQLREFGDRYALLKEDFAQAQQEQDIKSREPLTSADEVARLLSAAEAKYESTIFDLKRNLSVFEQERNENEANWSRKLREKAREVEDLRSIATSASRAEQQQEDIVSGLKDTIAMLQEENKLLQVQIRGYQGQSLLEQEVKKSWNETEHTLELKITALEQLIEEGKQRETQLRLLNKTIREELRKVQSSVALLEKQRNPGVGYWTSRVKDGSSATSQNAVVSPAVENVANETSSDGLHMQTMNDEEVNHEYLRNVILQFLEHKEMRPNLVKVLSIILHFTPQETRRLVAKV